MERERSLPDRSAPFLVCVHRGACRTGVQTPAAARPTATPHSEKRVRAEPRARKTTGEKLRFPARTPVQANRTTGTNGAREQGCVTLLRLVSPGNWDLTTPRIGISEQTKRVVCHLAGAYTLGNPRMYLPMRQWSTDTSPSNCAPDVIPCIG